ncbi:DUF1351 domain-containing protein [Eubacteriales bacterium OttesenSCG-928-A19]|nr:DUF1351 domain-containing protein [Eubacteriales bacterium OttesenSCG-928-A19]
MQTQTQELIIVEQLPIITERLKVVSEVIDRRIAPAMALECTEDTIKEVKKLRADLNKDFAEWEKRRKVVKSSIMSPYEAFEGAYKEYVSDKYKSADASLKRRVDALEGELKRKKAADVREYFHEYSLSKSVDFVQFEQSGINVTLSASLKSLKAQAKEFIDRICDDLALINAQERRDEILIEYYRTLNCSQAVTLVADRHKALAEQEAKRQEVEARKAAEQAVVAKVEAVVPLTPPVVARDNDPDPVMTLAFKVTAPLSKLKALKAFLNNGGYQYE